LITKTNHWFYWRRRHCRKW